MIKKNKYVLANYEWADIYNVSISTITNAKRKTEK
jgi:hypothetical protein